jgi:hypothetical protein
VKSYLDSTYAPMSLVGKFFYIKNYLPIAEIGFDKGRVGFLVEEIAYRQPSTRNDYFLYLFSPTGKRLSSTRIGGLDVAMSGGMERATIEEPTLKPGGIIEIRKTVSRENINSGAREEEVTITTMKLTDYGDFEVTGSKTIGGEDS